MHSLRTWHWDGTKINEIALFNNLLERLPATVLTGFLQPKQNSSLHVGHRTAHKTSVIVFTASDEDGV